MTQFGAQWSPRNILSKFHINPSNLHTLLIHLKKRILAKIKPKFFSPKVLKDYHTSPKQMSMRSSGRPIKFNLGTPKKFLTKIAHYWIKPARNICLHSNHKSIFICGSFHVVTEKVRYKRHDSDTRKGKTKEKRRELNREKKENPAARLAAKIGHQAILTKTWKIYVANLQIFFWQL